MLCTVPGRLSARRLYVLMSGSLRAADDRRIHLFSVLAAGVAMIAVEQGPRRLRCRSQARARAQQHHRRCLDHNDDETGGVPRVRQEPCASFSRRHSFRGIWKSGGRVVHIVIERHQSRFRGRVRFLRDAGESRGTRDSIVGRRGQVPDGTVHPYHVRGSLRRAEEKPHVRVTSSSAYGRVPA